MFIMDHPDEPGDDGGGECVLFLTRTTIIVYLNNSRCIAFKIHLYLV